MTAQLCDHFQHRDTVYALLDVNKGPFDPSILNLKPDSGNTGCYNGYQAFFKIVGEQLVLQNF